MKKQKKKIEKVNFVELIVNNYKTKYEYGFTHDEMLDLLKYFPDVTQEKFSEALGVRTCMLMEGEVITYHSDIRLALNCIINKRNPTIYEFD